MKNSVFKAVLTGILLGAAVYFMPGFMIGLLILFALIRLIAGRRMGHGRFARHRIAFADRIRGMSDDEFATFKNEMQTGSCYRYAQKENNK